MAGGTTAAAIWKLNRILAVLKKRCSFSIGRSPFFWFSEEKLEYEKIPYCEGALPVYTRFAWVPRFLYVACLCRRKDRREPSRCFHITVENLFRIKPLVYTAEATQVSYIAGDSQTHPLVLFCVTKKGDQY